EQFSGDKRNNQIFAAQAYAEHCCKQKHRFVARCEKQKWNRASNKDVDQKHYVLLGETIGKPTHQESSGDTERENKENDPARFSGGIVLIQTEEKLQMLIRPAYCADRTHASERKQIERGISEDINRGLERARIFAAEQYRRFFFDKQDQRQRKSNDDDAKYLKRGAPSEHLRQPVRQQRNDGAADADAKVG